MNVARWTMAASATDTERIWNVAERAGKTPIMVKQEITWPADLERGIQVEGSGPGVSNYHQIAGYHRCVNPAAVPRDAAHLFGQRMRPENLAMGAVTDEQSLHAVSVDVARFRIGCEAGPADAIEGDRRVEDVEAMFPFERAVGSIVGGDLLLLADALTTAAHDVNRPIEDNGSRSSGEVGAPQFIARGPTLDQAEICGGAVLGRSAPSRPVTRAGLYRESQYQDDGE